MERGEEYLVLRGCCSCLQLPCVEPTIQNDVVSSMSVVVHYISNIENGQLYSLTDRLIRDMIVLYPLSGSVKGSSTPILIVPGIPDHVWLNSSSVSCSGLIGGSYKLSVSGICMALGQIDGGWQMLAGGNWGIAQGGAISSKSRIGERCSSGMVWDGVVLLESGSLVNGWSGIDLAVSPISVVVNSNFDDLVAVQ